MLYGSRYELLPSFLIALHGTDAKTSEKILAGKGHLSSSENDYDWLGHGIYFWEYGPLRAYQFVQEKFKWQGRNEKVAVVGAIIDPGLCLNLLDAKGIGYLEAGYDALLTERGGEEFLPKTVTARNYGTASWIAPSLTWCMNSERLLRPMTGKTNTLAQHRYNRTTPCAEPLGKAVRSTQVRASRRRTMCKFA